MIRNRGWVERLLRIAAVLSVFGGYVACESTGKDGGETHWLRRCSTSSECDVGSCTCGVCTSPCATRDECTVYGGDAVCALVNSADFAALCKNEENLPGLCVRASDAGAPPVDATPEAEAALDAQTGDVVTDATVDARIGDAGDGGCACLPSSTPQSEFWVTNGSVYAMAVGDGVIYLGGTFTHVAPPTGSFAALDTGTGAPDLTKPRVVGSVYASAPDGSGGWYIGGEFTTWMVSCGAGSRILPAVVRSILPSTRRLTIG